MHGVGVLCDLSQLDVVALTADLGIHQQTQGVVVPCMVVGVGRLVELGLPVGSTVLPRVDDVVLDRGNSE